jgi:hypothetical protein
MFSSISSAASTSFSSSSPLRAALSDGAALNFLTPGCVMKLADPASIYCKLMAGRYGEISPAFVEYFGG